MTAVDLFLPLLLDLFGEPPPIILEQVIYQPRAIEHPEKRKPKRNRYRDRRNAERAKAAAENAANNQSVNQSDMQSASQLEIKSDPQK